MAVLLDVNVLVALAWPNHLHHRAAVEWFLARDQQPWATAPVTEAGFVRVSSNRLVIPEARQPAEAVLLLRQLTARDDHVFWADDVPFCRSEWIDAGRIVGHRQVTDAHLVALALRHQGQVATFDRGMANVVPANARAEDVLLTLG